MYSPVLSWWRVETVRNPKDAVSQMQPIIMTQQNVWVEVSASEVRMGWLGERNYFFELRSLKDVKSCYPTKQESEQYSRSK